jgi:hypothetical protein
MMKVLKKDVILFNRKTDDFYEPKLGILLVGCGKKFSQIFAEKGADYRRKVKQCVS